MCMCMYMYMYMYMYIILYICILYYSTYTYIWIYLVASFVFQKKNPVPCHRLDPHLASSHPRAHIGGAWAFPRCDPPQSPANITRIEGTSEKQDGSRYPKMNITH